MTDRCHGDEPTKFSNRTHCNGRPTRDTFTASPGGAIWYWHCPKCEGEWILYPGQPHIIPHPLTYSLDA